MKKFFLFLISVVIAFQILNVQAQTETSAIPYISQAKDAKGIQFRNQANQLVALISAKRFDEAEKLALNLRKSYEAIFSPELKQYTFHSQAEFDELKNNLAGPFEWIDWGYKICLQMQAFLKVEKKDFDGAMDILNEIKKIAPVSAGSANEIGYILNQQNKFEDALEIYRLAFNISSKYISQRAYQAAALRGMGFSLIELNRLDEAENVLNDSLKIEPNNVLAQNELVYIQRMRSTKVVVIR